jgi:metacaspase-1
MSRKPEKRALLVGINAYSDGALNGCVNDVIRINQVITNHFGFTDSKNKRMLTDKSATTKNILDRLTWLVADAQPGDVLYFHYSGHGSQMVDTDYDLSIEPDGMDEIICPVDLNWRDLVVKDDDFARIFSTVPEGVNLTVALDCCHSGGGLREFGHTPNKTRHLPTPADIMNRAFDKNLAPKARGIYIDRNIHTIEDQKGALISGCRSDQTSADAWIQKARKYMGAFTHYFTEVLESNSWDMSYEDLIIETNKVLERSGYDQRPELNSTTDFKNKKFLQPL